MGLRPSLLKIFLNIFLNKIFKKFFTAQSCKNLYLKFGTKFLYKVGFNELPLKEFLHCYNPANNGVCNRVDWIFPKCAGGGALSYSPQLQAHSLSLCGLDNDHMSC